MPATSEPQGSKILSVSQITGSSNARADRINVDSDEIIVVEDYGNSFGPMVAYGESGSVSFRTTPGNNYAAILLENITPGAGWNYKTNDMQTLIPQMTTWTVPRNATVKLAPAGTVFGTATTVECPANVWEAVVAEANRGMSPFGKSYGSVSIDSSSAYTVGCINEPSNPNGGGANRSIAQINLARLRTTNYQISVGLEEMLFLLKGGPDDIMGEGSADELTAWSGRLTDDGVKVYARSAAFQKTR